MTVDRRRRGLVERLAGGVLVLAGIAGLFLPIVPGWILIFGGLALMGEERLFHWLRNRYHRHRTGRNTPGCPPPP